MPFGPFCPLEISVPNVPNVAEPDWQMAKNIAGRKQIGSYLYVWKRAKKIEKQ